jgi:hypothetical protein
MHIEKFYTNTYGYAFLVATALFLSGSALGQDKKPACGAPGDWLVKPKFTDAEIAKWKDKSVTVTVVLQISEKGDVIDAHIRSVKPKEAGPAVLSAMRRSKYSARPGCGNWTLEITFNLHPDAPQDKDK